MEKFGGTEVSQDSLAFCFLLSCKFKQVFSSLVCSLKHLREKGHLSACLDSEEDEHNTVYA